MLAGARSSRGLTHVRRDGCVSAHASESQRINREPVFRAAAVLFAAAATYHTVAIAVPTLGIPGATWRHALFAALGAAAAWSLARPSVRRRPWILPAFTAFTAQQLYSHGGRALTWWRTGRGVDWMSLGVLLVMISVLAILTREAAERMSRCVVSEKS